MINFETNLAGSGQAADKKFFSLDKPGQAELDKKFDDYLKTEILLKSKKINEGNNGVIGVVDLDYFPPQAGQASNQEAEQKSGDKSSTDKTHTKLATKILKIYQFGAGEQEFSMQKRVSDLINEANSDEFIKVPQIYFYRQLEVNDNDSALQEKLEFDGIDLSSKKCDLMLMDLIPGEDLGTYLYKEIVKRADNRDLLNDQELIDFREEIKAGNTQPDLARLNEVVDLVVGLTFGDQQADAMTVTKIEQANHLKIIKFLQSKNFQLDKNKFDKIEKTLTYLHKNGIYHRDLHERNIMLTYDEAGEIADFYLVDFGSATDLKDNSESEAYQDKDKNYLYRDDKSILRIYQALTKNPVDLKQEKSLKLLNNLERTSQRLKNRPEVKELWSQALAAASLSKLSPAIEEAVKKLTHDDVAGWEIRYALIADLAKNNTPLAKEYIQANLPKVPLAIKNNLHQINHLF